MQCFKDRLGDVFDSGCHVDVPEAQDAKASTPQEGVAMQIVWRLIEMLAAVQLDDNGGFQANEIADIRVDPMLPSEFETAQLTAAQSTPEKAFSLRRIPAQVAGEVDHSGRAS
jgi:hypothetical protein